MIKKTINYTDYNDNEREEVAFFNLDENELFDMNLSHEGGFEAYFNSIMETSNAAKVVALLKEIIALSYGRKSPDGRKFEKSPEILADFMATPAYGVLYMDLVSDAEKLADFMNGIISSAAKKKIDAATNDLRVVD